MNYIIATDKFKGSLTAEEVGKAIEKGICQVDKSANFIHFPLADGGEGTMLILNKILGGKLISVTALDPLFRPITARYCWLNDGVAIIEMAEVSGLLLLDENERNPLKTSTLGTGQLIKHAIEKGAKKVILCIGGSATNDAGIGMAVALGFCFYDKNGHELLPIGENLSQIESIEWPNFDFSAIEFEVLTDVTAPFFGKNGAAYMYAAQKGANESQMEVLDNGLAHLNQLAKQTQNLDLQTIKGSGAAGGLGGGAVFFLNAKLKSGTQTILELIDFKNEIEKCDWVITGEGKIDPQTLQNKVVNGVVAACVAAHKNGVVFCGINELETNKLGNAKIFPISKLASSTEESMRKAAYLLEKMATSWAKEVLM